MHKKTKILKPFFFTLFNKNYVSFLFGALYKHLKDFAVVVRVVVVCADILFAYMISICTYMYVIWFQSKNRQTHRRDIL